MKAELKIKQRINDDAPNDAPDCEQCGTEGGHAEWFFTTDDGMGMQYDLCPEETYVSPAAHPRCDWCDVDLTDDHPAGKAAKMPHPSRAEPFDLCLGCFSTVIDQEGGRD